jgi:GntR family transcriptional regulator, rspAB operon transcriptional repressor
MHGKTYSRTYSRTYSLKIEKQPRLRQIVYEKLKDAILTGAIPKGTRLYESRIAEETGISRTPVREALHALEREGLIIAIDKVGYQIVDMTLEDLEEISEIRKATEAIALKRAIDRVGENEVRKLEENIRKYENAVAHRRSEQVVQLDAEFHRILCSLSHSERLIRMADTLGREMARFRNRAKENQALAKVAIQHHKKIVMFLKKKDYLGAKGALNEHIDYIKEESRKGFTETT